MNQSTGNLVRLETSTSVMLQGNYMLFQMTWLHTYQSTSKLPLLSSLYIERSFKSHCHWMSQYIDYTYLSCVSCF